MATVEDCLLCFETLSANLEKRTPMTRYQIQNSWADYPKGLEGDDDDDEEPPADSEPEESKSSHPRIPALKRLAKLRSASSSSSSLSPDTATTTPCSSTEFTQIGVHPRRTSQRSNTLTESPLFVTWNTIDPSYSDEKMLRGCIGTFSSEPLNTAISQYALISALQDHRFNPISLSELPTLEVSVTLLTDFENCRDPLDWELGIHGIRISFYARNKRYSACYLPDVAVEQGWDKEETVVSAMRKGGWSGKTEKWREVGDLKVTRFQGRAESVGWGEYKRWKEWVEKGRNNK